MTASQTLLASPARRKISLTALIDVVFILLMFFMLTASFTQYAESTLNTPTASEHTVNDSPQILRLSADRQVTVLGSDGGAPLDLQDAIAGLDPEAPVILLPHADVDLQTILSVFEMLQARGAAQLTLGEAWGGELD
ncbi:MAG: biopolymer transporter ExbD [Halioglobus sp.]|nr:biopolymer transporter ExbD [Halioglobus sp.]